MQSVIGFAQEPTIKAKMDSVAILVGEQTKIHLEITKSSKRSVQIPILQDTIITGIDIIDITKRDTIKLDNDLEQINIDYLITGFDEGLYYIPPFPIVSQSDTFYSNPLSLKIATMQVDTVSKAFYDIKPVLKPKFVLADYIYILVIIWIVLVILAVIIYFIFFKKKKVKTIFKKKPEVLPHTKALAALEEVKRKKLWQQGFNKEYYTEITDILRTYLYERFGINAQEMTSDEILTSIKKFHEAQSAYDNLKQILKLSDLAKFAKFSPLPDENDLSYINAGLFVSQTQPEEKVQKENDKEKSDKIGRAHV
jgi:hypothetical protein